MDLYEDVLDLSTLRPASSDWERALGPPRLLGSMAEQSKRLAPFLQKRVFKDPTEVAMRDADLFPTFRSLNHCCMKFFFNVKHCKTTLDTYGVKAVSIGILYNFGLAHLN